MAAEELISTTVDNITSATSNVPFINTLATGVQYIFGMLLYIAGGIIGLYVLYFLINLLERRRFSNLIKKLSFQLDHMNDTLTEMNKTNRAILEKIEIISQEGGSKKRAKKPQ